MMIMQTSLTTACRGILKIFEHFIAGFVQKINYM
jgi:hypothetical protein